MNTPQARSKSYSAMRVAKRSINATSQRAMFLSIKGKKRKRTVLGGFDKVTSATGSPLKC